MEIAMVTGGLKALRRTKRARSEADKAEAVRTGGALFETPTAGGGGGRA